MREGDFTNDELKSACRLENRELDGHLGGDLKPKKKTAFNIGTFFGSRVACVSGITGLYAGGHLSSVIHVLNQAVPSVGPGTVLVLLATLPLIVETEFARSASERADVDTARRLAMLAFAKYGSIINDEWRCLPQDRKFQKFHRRSDDVGIAFHEAYRIAVTLEDGGNHTLREIRNACFPTIFLEVRDIDFRESAAEQLFMNHRGYERGYDLHQPVNPSDLDYWLELGRRLGFGGNSAYRIVDELPAGARLPENELSQT